MAPLTEEHIWEVLDGEASSEMLAQHEVLLRADASYRTTFVQCEQLHRQLLSLPLESPSMRFTENLIDRLAPERRLAPKTDRLPLIFLAVFSFLSACLALLVFRTEKIGAASEKGLTTEGVVATLSNPIFVQVFMLLNIILFFAILDKKVLRPYFENRAKLKRG
jgi:hypothetical protein